jgi:type I thyroxine 5'-deiodinase
MRSNVKEGVIFATQRADGKRVEIAESCVRRLGIRFPALIDGMDNNSIERRYTGPIARC